MIDKIQIFLDLYYNKKYFEVCKATYFKDFHNIVIFTTKNRGRKRKFDIKNSEYFKVIIGKNKKLFISFGNKLI